MPSFQPSSFRIHIQRPETGTIRLLFIIFFLIVFFPEFLYSQTKKDSLYIKLGSLTDKGTTQEKADIFKEMESTCYFNLLEYDSAVYFGKKALLLYRKTENELNIAYVYKVMGYSLVDKEDYPEGITYLDSALEIYSRHDKLLPIIQIYTNKGIAYSYIESNRKSIEAFQKAIDYSIELGDSNQTAINLLNIGIMYNFSGDYPNATKSLIEAASVFEKLKDSTTVINTYIEIGNVYQAWEKYNTALFYYSKALNQEKFITDKKILTSLYDVMGDAFEKQDSINEALAYYTKVLDVSRDIDYRSGISQGLYKLGNLKMLNKDYTAAIDYYQEALAIEKNIGANQDILCMEQKLAECYLNTGNYNESLKRARKARGLCLDYDFRKDLSENNFLLYKIFKAKGQPDSALVYYENYIGLKDSIYGEKQEMLMEDLREKYETEKKERTIAELNSEKQLQNEKIARQRTLFISLVSLFVMLAVIVLLIYLQKKRKEEIRRLQMQQQLFRSRLNPHFLFNALNAIKNVVAEKNEEVAADYLVDFSRLMRLILEESYKDFITMEEELEMLKCYLSLQQLRFKHGFEYRFNVDESINTEEAMFPSMMLQPFVENAVEHGMRKGGKQIELNFRADQSGILVQIKDDGPGFEHPANAPEREHEPRAISITKERIQVFKKLYNWIITFDVSKEGNGVLVNFRVPYKHSNLENE